jgi:glycosyltransferase involved in cell wall biosynthesis
MRIGFISTRLNGMDGVSLEVEKWAKVLRKMGHEVFFCAGEFGGYAKDGTRIPTLHFAHHTIHALSQRAFGPDASKNPQALYDEIYEHADEIRKPLRKFIRSNKLDLIIVQNALTIPMNLPLGISLTGLIAELGINTIAHHHDFFWERERYQANAIMDLLDTTFPAKLPNIRHVVINTIAQKRLKERRGIDSVYIPNVLDFDTPAPGMDDYNSDLRQALGVNKGEYFILQPTRVIPRKGIETAIELLHNLDLKNPTLYISHNMIDEGKTYLNWLEREAHVMEVRLKLLHPFVAAERAQVNSHKVYSLWDVYAQTDMVTYPSTYEGFGNALLECVYFRKPLVVNRYPVYNADIKPLGFDFIELDGFLNEEAVGKAGSVLKDPKSYQGTAEKNYAIARENFSFGVLEKNLRKLLRSF